MGCGLSKTTKKMERQRCNRCMGRSIDERYEGLKKMKPLIEIHPFLQQTILSLLFMPSLGPGSGYIADS